MRRNITRLLVALAILFVAEIRLSRSEPRPSEPPRPALWENANPPGRPSPSPDVSRSARGLTVTYPSPAVNCPIVISTDPDSQHRLTAAENGVLFDIDADGDLDRVAWTEPATDVAFLALDRDGDGRITSGRELIGDRTLPDVANGPSALIQLATQTGAQGPLDGDDRLLLANMRQGTLDGDNPLLANIRLWRDANHNGKSEASELRPAADELSTIGLGFQTERRIDRHGNQSRFRGFVHVRTAPGKNMATTTQDERARRRSMYDICLVTQ